MTKDQAIANVARWYADEDNDKTSAEDLHDMLVNLCDTVAEIKVACVEAEERKTDQVEIEAGKAGEA